MQASELLSAYLNYLTTDATKWRDLFDENAVMEFPYASAIGTAERLEGIIAIFGFVHGAALAQMSEPVLSNIRIQSINGENAVGEFELVTTIKTTGKIYEQKFVIFVTSKNGKIVQAKEYFNPAQVKKAFDM